MKPKIKNKNKNKQNVTDLPNLSYLKPYERNLKNLNNKTWVVEYRVAYGKQISLGFCRFSPYTNNFTSKSNKTVFVNTVRRVLKFSLC